MELVEDRIGALLAEADSADLEHTVRVGISGLARLLADLEHLRKQRDDLQVSNSKLLKLTRAGNEAGLLVGLGADERRVLAVLADRLRGGAKAYGALDLASDRRDFEKERGEEVADLLVYSAFAELKRLSAGGKL